MTAAPRPILAIQYLRALAVLGVVLFHASQWIGTYFEIGAAGVDLFFVISGFIIWTVTVGRPITPLDFIRRRALRVAPLYWLATLSGLAVIAVNPQALPLIEARPLSHVILSLLFIPHRDPAGWAFPVLDVGWTLTYEAFFYLVFAVALMLDEGERAWLVTLTLLGVALIGLAVPPLYPLGANLILLEFAAGVWLARAYAAGRLPNAWTCGLLIAAGLAAIVWQYALGYRPDLWRPLLWGGPALAIAAGALGLERLGRMPRLPGLKTLGDASYSIYLAHTLLAPLVPWAIGRHRPLLLAALMVVLGIGGGLLVRWLIEAPLLRAVGALPRRGAGKLEEAAAP